MYIYIYKYIYIDINIYIYYIYTSCFIKGHHFQKTLTGSSAYPTQTTHKCTHLDTLSSSISGPISASKQRHMAVLLWIENINHGLIANKSGERKAEGSKMIFWFFGPEHLANLFWNCCIKLNPILTTQSGTMSQPTSKEESNLCHPPSKIWRFSSVTQLFNEVFYHPSFQDGSA